MGRRLLLSLAALFALWLVGLVAFAAGMPSPTDGGGDKGGGSAEAVVVLTGGTERLRTGLALLEDGGQSKLFVSGVNSAARIEDLMAGEGKDWLGDRQRIVLGYGASDTMGNAYETAAWVRKEDLTSFTLVTAAYHMPRALLEMRFVLPDIRIKPHPVFPPAVKHDNWWRWPGTASLVAREYTKYLVVHLRRWLQNFAD